jgi:predicted metal-dependent phosphoesterase TrpH
MVKLKVDMHAHSDITQEPYMRSCTPRRVIQRAFDIGLDVLNITDFEIDGFLDLISIDPDRNLPRGIECYGHTEDDGYLYLEKDGKGLYLFRGMEWPNPDSSGHLLSVGHQKPIRFDFNRNYTLAERIEIIHDHGGLAGAAHPLNVKYGGIGLDMLTNHADLLDFVEIFNPLNVVNPEYDSRAENEGKRLGLPGLANSDAHDPRHIGMAHTILEVDLGGLPKRSPLVRERVLEAVVKGDREFEKNYTSKFDMGRIFILNRIVNGTLARDWHEVERGIGLARDYLIREK